MLLYEQAVSEVEEYCIVIIAHAGNSRKSKAFMCVCVCVILYVCLQHNFK